MQKVLIVFGTRPEAIKMAPLVKEFQKYPDSFQLKVCVTAQHREMLDQVLSFFEIVPDFDLNLMKPDQNLYQLTANVMLGMQTVLQEFTPDYVFVHGDTTTSSIAALAAFYAGAKVCHVEAGLRTYNKQSPFPEEINRQITGRLADLHFTPTDASRQNLLRENVKSNHIIVTGNTVIDALMYSKNKVEVIDDDEIEFLKTIVDQAKKIVLVTGHRRENFGDGFLDICTALKELSKDDGVQIIYPVHLNPNVQGPVYRILSDISNVHLINPLSYPAFVWLMSRSYIVLTDSGGLQEEAPSLGKPVLVMRNTTERPEAVDAGTVKLVGTDEKEIIRQVRLLLSSESEYDAMANKQNPYGAGVSSKSIVQYLLDNG